jgi:ABC-type uncharacterized transport system YnjBCD ATPase subunit
VQALEGVDLQLRKGEIVGLVGESGSGKSVLSYALLGISDAAAQVTGRQRAVRRHRPAAGRRGQLPELRGREISMIFQSPRTALNPIRPVGQQIEDVLRRHAVPRAAAPGPTPAGLRERASRRCATWPSPTPSGAGDAYPFELSGGMCQRVMIAIALACRPQPADRRRAHHRPGRDHAGRGDGPDHRPGARTPDGHAVHHPRPGAGRRLLRPHRRDARRPRGGSAPTRRCSRSRATPTPRG